MDLSRLPKHYNKLIKKEKQIEPVISIVDKQSKRQSTDKDIEQDNSCSGSMCNIMSLNKKKNVNVNQNVNLKKKSKRKSKKNNYSTLICSSSESVSFSDSVSDSIHPKNS